MCVWHLIVCVCVCGTVCVCLYVRVQTTIHEHYVNVVGSTFNFLSGDSVNGYKFTVNSHEVRLIDPCPLLPTVVSCGMRANLCGVKLVLVLRALRVHVALALCFAVLPPFSARGDLWSVNFVLRVGACHPSRAWRYSCVDPPPHWQLTDAGRLPSVKFTYILSPMTVIVTESRKPFYQFLTSLCAIIGGCFTVIGLVDSVVYHGMKSIRKKLALGKQG